LAAWHSHAEVVPGPRSPAAQPGQEQLASRASRRRHIGMTATTLTQHEPTPAARRAEHAAAVTPI
jgi:hypothetical protein